MDADPCEAFLQTKKLIRECLLHIYRSEVEHIQEDMKFLHFMLSIPEGAHHPRVQQSLLERGKKLEELKREVDRISISC